jgi:GT2 family glycosyltransferase
MPKVSIMIPSTIGGFTYLARLLPDLAIEAEKSDAEIIVIDNASRDGTSNFLGNYECKMIVNKTNKGFGIAHNQGAKIAQGEYLLLLNNDTIITPGFIKTMLDTFALDSDIGIVGCCIYLMDGVTRIQHAGVCFTDDYVPYELGQPVSDLAPGLVAGDWRIGSVREIPSVTAACMMIKKELYDQLGGFDERYVNGWEDTDLVLRAKELGKKVWYNGQAVIYHKKHGTTSFRFAKENENRALYDSLWLNTGKAKKLIGEQRQ